MPEQIDELFVKLGLETDQREFTEAKNAFGGLRTKVLQFGAAIGAGFGLRGLTFGFAEANAEIGRVADRFGTTTEFVSDLGFAFEQMGGSSSDALSSISSMADLIENTDWGNLPEDAFRIPGFDPRVLESTESMAEAYQLLSGALGSVDQESARRAAKALGITGAEFDLLRSGNLQSLMADGRNLNPVSGDMSESAQEFQDAVSRFSAAAEGIRNEFSMLGIGGLSDAINSLAGTIANNREGIVDTAEEAMPWLEAAAVSVGSIMAAIGGKAALTKMAGFAGKAGPFLGVGLGYQFMKETPDHFKDSLAAANESDFLKTFMDTLPFLGRERTMSRMSGEKDQPGDDFLRDLFGGEGRGGADMMRPRDFIPGPAPGPQASNTYNIDARGSNDPVAVEQAAMRGVDRAIAKAAENTVRDFRGAVS